MTFATVVDLLVKNISVMISIGSCFVECSIKIVLIAVMRYNLSWSNIVSIARND